MNTLNLKHKLVRAVIERDKVKVKLLLDAGANPEILVVNSSNGDYMSLLFYALLNKVDGEDSNDTIVKSLVEAGADVNHVPEPCDKTPLFAAIYFRKSTVEYLLKHGANPNISNKKHPLLALCIDDNDIECFKLLLEHGADPNVTIPHNQYTCGTVLSGAILSRQNKFVELLIQHGARMKFEDYLWMYLINPYLNYVDKLVNVYTNIFSKRKDDSHV